MTKQLNYYFITALSFFLILSSGDASAHTNAASAGLISGLTHPIFGTDHLLAMLAVGIVSAQIGGKQVWIIPALFVASMIAGGLMGFAQLSIPFVETGIALSVVLLGAAILIGNRGVVSIFVSFMVVAFGIFHGYAHGLEMPEAASPIFYSVGFVIATSTIHLLGVGIGHVFTNGKFNKPIWLQVVGALLMGSGIYILTS